MGTKIAVLGTGANGSSVAADMTRAGHDVTLIDQWPAHVEAMRAGGLRIQMPDEEINVAVTAHHLCDVATFTHCFDMVFVVVKAYDTRWITELIAPYVAGDGLVIGLQNGMTVDDIVAAVGISRTIGCVVELSSEIFTPGLVKRNTPPDHTWFGLGSLDPSTAGREAEVAAVLGAAGRVAIQPNIVSAKWMKLIVNAMTMGPRALSGLGAVDAMELPGMRDIALRAGEEALAAGQAQGFTIEPIFGLRREDVEGSNRLLELLLDKIIADVGPHARDAVLHDHLKGRLSEVDEINGRVAEVCAANGRPAPVNAAVTEVTRRIHAGEIKPEPGNLDLVKALIER
jgi:2-dehydropantoate 2-reductase